MRKIAVIFIMFFVLLLGSNTKAMADKIEGDIDMAKYVTADGEEYSFSIEVDGRDLESLEKIAIKVPKHKIVWLNNTSSLFLNVSLDIGAEGMSFDEFKKKFPEGLYQVIAYPAKYGKLKANMSHEFPPTAKITYPEDGAKNIPITPTITWEPLSGMQDFRVNISNDDLEFYDEFENLPTDSTSVTIPEGWLEPNTEYRLEVETQNTDGNYNDHETHRIIYFTTAATPFSAAEPFAGEFRGEIEQGGVIYIINYTLKQAEANIKGTVSIKNDATLNVSGTVNSDKKSADITVADATQIGAPSDFVRVTLVGNGESDVTMQYLDAIGGTPVGTVVTYERLIK